MSNMWSVVTKVHYSRKTATSEVIAVFYKSQTVSCRSVFAQGELLCWGFPDSCCSSRFVRADSDSWHRGGKGNRKPELRPNTAPVKPGAAAFRGSSGPLASYHCIQKHLQPTMQSVAWLQTITDVTARGDEVDSAFQWPQRLPCLTLAVRSRLIALLFIR